MGLDYLIFIIKELVKFCLLLIIFCNSFFIMLYFVLYFICFFIVFILWIFGKWIFLGFGYDILMIVDFRYCFFRDSIRQEVCFRFLLLLKIRMGGQFFLFDVRLYKDVIIFVLLNGIFSLVREVLKKCFLFIWKVIGDFIFDKFVYFCIFRGEFCVMLQLFICILFLLFIDDFCGRYFEMLGLVIIILLGFWVIMIGNGIVIKDFMLVK